MLIFIDIPYVSVSWQPPKYDIPSGFGENCVFAICASVTFLARFLAFRRFCLYKRKPKTQFKAENAIKPRKVLYVSQKYGNPGNLIWRGRRIHGLLKPIHIGMLIFIDIPYVSVSWQPPKYYIPLVSVRIALLQFAKVLRFFIILCIWTVLLL